MSLLQQRARKNHEEQESFRPEPHGRVNQSTVLLTPIHAELQGEAVRILATGDVTGFSPSYLLVDQEGYTAWVPLSEVRIIDPNFMPIQGLMAKPR
jgi:hypothetical protein